MNQDDITELYLSWVNDFLTLEYFCEYYALTRRQAQRAIKAGEMLFYGKNYLPRNFNTIEI